MASWSIATTLEFLLQQVLETENLTTAVNPARKNKHKMKDKLFVEIKGLKNQEKILENPGLPQPGRQVAVTAILTGGLEPTYQKFRSTEKIKEVRLTQLPSKRDCHRNPLLRQHIVEAWSGGTLVE